MYAKIRTYTERDVMKKLLSAFLCMAMVCVMAGCSSKEPTPSDSAKAFLDAYKAQNSEELNKYATKEFSKEDMIGFTDDMSDIPAESQEAMKEALKKIVDVEYTIGEETPSEDKATVAVSMTSYPLGETFQKWLGEALATALANAFNPTMSEEEANKQIADSLINALNGMEKTYKKDVVVNLVKVDDTWKVDTDNNDDLLDALSGGLTSIDMSALEE